MSQSHSDLAGLEMSHTAGESGPSGTESGVSDESHDKSHDRSVAYGGSGDQSHDLQEGAVGGSSSVPDQLVDTLREVITTL